MSPFNFMDEIYISRGECKHPKEKRERERERSKVDGKVSLLSRILTYTKYMLDNTW